ncbi:alpha/beta-hydrolase [Peniophora sp. CONT]|nr:alpha/beta-hydrolase [Peniophora sp. CONT]
MASIVLESSKFKQATVSRGFSYNYYYSPARDDKPTLLFVHGYPSTSADWAGVVAVLEPEGHGILVPDMLGYGKTDKPTDPALYVANSGIVLDLLDLLDAEGIIKAVAIGHDWGSFFTSRLANLHVDRFLGFGFVTMGYIAPLPDDSLEEKVKEISEKLGYNVFGYFPLLGYGEKLIEQHMDSFMDWTFPEDDLIHRYHLCPPGAGQAWLEADRRCPRLSSAVATPDWFAARQELFARGMTPPACYYKVQLSGLAQADEKAAAVPSDAYYLRKPVFFAACTKDAPSPPVVGDGNLRAYARGSVTRREYDTGHWVILTHYEQLGEDLSAWLKDVDFHGV